MTDLHNISVLRPSIVASGEGERIWFTNAEMTVKATDETTDGHLSLLEVNAPAGHGPPLHVHENEHEAFYVLEGTLEVMVGGERRRAEAGTFAFLPRGIPHTFKVVEGPARFLTFGVPGGLDGFFRDGGRPAEGPGLPPPGPLDIQRMLEVGPRYGAQILGPPLD
jgi:quercetin dioxygenase-like cupin family protein